MLKEKAFCHTGAKHIYHCSLKKKKVVWTVTGTVLSRLTQPLTYGGGQTSPHSAPWWDHDAPTQPPAVAPSMASTLGTSASPTVPFHFAFSRSIISGLFPVPQYCKMPSRVDFFFPVKVSFGSKHEGRTFQKRFCRHCHLSLQPPVFLYGTDCSASKHHQRLFHSHEHH